MRVLFCGKNYSQALKDSDPVSILLIAKSIGWDIVDSLEDEPNRVICVDFNKQSKKLILEAKRLGIQRTLIVNEPEVVIPQNADARFLDQFDRVIRVGRPSGEKTICWPQTWRVADWNGSRKSRAVIVCADKWSFIKGQLYWLRLGALSASSHLDLYGRDWNRNRLSRLILRTFELFSTLKLGVWPTFTGLRHLLSRPQNFYGEVEDKLKVMSNYRVALVIENSKELLTEKLFDAWFAGCIPVYVGPPLEAFDLRSDLAIECEADVESVKCAIEFALSINYGDYQLRLKEYLSNLELRQRWSSKEALQAILNASV